ncbi:MAG: adenylate/guanylate cyclase domain-containing protein [Eubacteriales bacterium]|nr:adenylate/guanylate cyclase domain-containing protein [Eubacteriales bacterium]
MAGLKKVLLALIPAVLVFILIMFNPITGLDSWLSDLLYSHMSGTGDTIKLIAIDEETLAEYGPLSTWSREKSAKLLDVLYADPSNKPAVTAFDIMFIGETDEETDRRLAEAMEKAGNVVVASHVVYRGATKYAADGSIYYDTWNIDSEELPYEGVQNAAKSGYANTIVSADGFVRTTQIRAYVGDTLRYSFATEIYNEHARQGGSVKPLPGKDTIRFFYSGKPGEFIHYSLKDVIDGRVPASEFKDSIVMVGAYAAGLQDSYHSAADRGQDMYGVEINANITKALMEGRTAVSAKAWLVALITALVIFGYTLMAREMKMYPAIIVGIWVMIAAGVIGRILSSNGIIISVSYTFLVMLLIFAWIIIEKYVLEALRRKQTLNSFKKYMAPQVIDALAKNGEFHIELGGEKRHIAVLFVDIRGFTTMSEILSPEQMVQILNKYLSLTTSCIFDNGGMLDKFIGDATMALFNAPGDQEDYVMQAVKAGLDMQRRGAALGKELEEEFGRTVSFGVGVNVGDAVVGNIGCDTRMDYTAIGDTVNTASRIEGKAQRGELLISQAVYDILKDRIVAEFKEAMTLKGKAEPVNVYSVTGIRE